MLSSSAQLERKMVATLRHHFAVLVLVLDVHAHAAHLVEDLAARIHLSCIGHDADRRGFEPVTLQNSGHEAARSRPQAVDTRHAVPIVEAH